MKIIKSRLHHVNMGNYESFESFASVEIECGDKPADVEMATIKADEALDIITYPDLDDARINTDEEKSYVHSYFQDLKQRSTTRATNS
jgi:hypothetical protein